MTGALTIQAVLAGLAAGAVYGLVGLGYTLVHRISGRHQLGHGDVVVGAVFLGVLAAVGRRPVALSPSVLAGVAEVAVALLAGVILSVAIASIAGSARTAAAWVVAAVAGGLVVREVIGLTFPREAYAIGDPLHLDQLTASGLVDLPGGATLPVRTFGVLVVGLAAGVVIERLIAKTRTGRALRAVGDEPAIASLCGIDAAKMTRVAFALAGLLAGLAGVLIAPGVRLAPGAGAVLGLKGVAAALVGGLGSPRGALTGGAVIGVAEALATTWPRLGPAYADVVPLVLLLVALRWRTGAAR